MNNLNFGEKEIFYTEKIVDILSKRHGKSMAISSVGIINSLNSDYGIKIKASLVRKIINNIRVNYLIPGLIAAHDGYYISDSRKEIVGYIKSLKHREDCIANVRLCMEKYLTHLIKQ